MTKNTQRDWTGIEGAIKMKLKIKQLRILKSANFVLNKSLTLGKVDSYRRACLFKFQKTILSCC